MVVLMMGGILEYLEFNWYLLEAQTEHHTYPYLYKLRTILIGLRFEMLV
jgi:hypothetical protein